MTVMVRIENDYSDGHHSEFVVPVEDPDDDHLKDLDEWASDVIFEHTGDGHGKDGLGSCYTATIVASDNPLLIGEVFEWVD